MENTLRHQQPYTDFSRIIRVKSEYIKEGQKIMDDKKVARINELYHKSKAEGLTPEELKEQQILRKEYIDSFKRNLRGQLNNISIKEKDGSITNLGEKFGKQKRKLDIRSSASEKRWIRLCGNRPPILSRKQ